MKLYDKIAPFYDPWSRSVTEDVEFYVEQALASGGPVVELAVGTGRITVPIAQAGINVIGVVRTGAGLPSPLVRPLRGRSRIQATWPARQRSSSQSGR